MMPKAKADSVVTHRLELQETERALLEGFLIGKTVTNALAPVATLLAPAVGALAVWYTASWTKDEFVEFLDRQTENVRDVYSSVGLQKYNEVLAVLVTVNWDAFAPTQGGGHSPELSALGLQVRELFTEEQVPSPIDREWLQHLERNALLFLNNFNPVMRGAIQNVAEAEAQGWSVPDAFINFYPETQMENDIIFQRSPSNSRGPFTATALLLWDFIRSPFA